MLNKIQIPKNNSKEMINLAINGEKNQLEKPNSTKVISKDSMG